MRLLFSLTVLLITASVIMETFAAKSKRGGTDRTEEVPKSMDSKEVRYAKSGSEVKRSGSGKKQEALKERKQRRDVRGTEKINSDEFSKKNAKERNGEAASGDQKRHRPNKQVKTVESGDRLANGDQIKSVADDAKRRKRSPKLEQREEKISRRGSADGESNDDFEKKSKEGNGKVAESDVTPNNEERMSDERPAESQVRSGRSSGDSEVAEGRGKKSKIPKQQKRVNKRDESRAKDANMKKGCVETGQEFAESEEGSEYFAEWSENVENFNVNKLQKPRSEIRKCECQRNERAKKSKPKSIELTDECSSKSRDNRRNKKSNHAAGDRERIDAAAESDRGAFNDEESEDFRSKLLDEEEIEEEDYEVADAGDCAGSKSARGNVKREFCSTE